MNKITTFIIPSIGRPSLQRAIDSAKNLAPVLHAIDTERVGAGEIRNKLIEQADTEWVSFLDDDDHVTIDYVERLLEEIKNNPEADVIHFREYFPWGQFLPAWPSVEWGNIGISFSVKRSVALEHPFISEQYEDYHFVRRIHEAGKNVAFSKHLTYMSGHCYERTTNPRTS